MTLLLIFGVLAFMIFVSVVAADARDVAVRHLGWRIGIIILLLLGGLFGTRYWLTWAIPCFPNCTGLNFLDRDFSGRVFPSGNFVEAHMQRAKFMDADLRNSDFSGADLQGSDFRGADLRFTFFIGSDLRKANLGASILQNASLQGADLTGSNLAGVDLSQAELSGAILNEAILIGTNLSGANLGGIELRGADLSGADLSGALLAGASLSEANLSGADLRGANLQGAFINLATMTGADLSGATLSGASLIGTDISSANLQNAGLIGALIMGATFDGADLRGAQLRHMRDVEHVTPEDIALDPVLAGLNALQREAIIIPSSLEGIVVDSTTLAPAELLPEVVEETIGSQVNQVSVGVLHSVSGELAFSESAVLDATLLAISEINAAGGVLNHQIEPIVEDGASDSIVFAEKAAKLLEIDQVNVVFGVSTTASRQAVTPIFEENNSLLFYPTQHEGLGQSENIFYMGADPSQQIMPTIDYLLEQGYETFFLIGSNREYAQIAHPLIKAQLASAQVELLGEVLVPPRETNVSFAVREIAFLKPSIVLSTLVGDSNRAFFEALTAEQISAFSMPVVSFSMAEAEVQGIGVDNVAGHLVAGSYFQTLNTIENFSFVDSYKEVNGRDAVTSDAIMYGYASVYLWRALVEEAGSFDISGVRRAAASSIELQTPNGILQLDPETQYIAKPLRIGQIRPDGLIEAIFTSPDNIEPDPFLSQYPWSVDIVPMLLGEGQ